MRPKHPEIHVCLDQEGAEATIELVAQALHRHGVDDQQFRQEAADQQGSDIPATTLITVCAAWVDIEIGEVWDEPLQSEYALTERDARWAKIHDAYGSGDPQPLIQKLLSLVEDAALPEYALATLAKLPKRGARSAAQPLVSHLLNLARGRVPPKWLPRLEKVVNDIKRAAPTKYYGDTWLRRRSERKDRAIAYHLYKRRADELRAARIPVDRENLIKDVVAEVRASGGRVTTNELKGDLGNYERRLKRYDL